MKKFISNERGSGIFFTIFYIVIFGIALILILNIAMVFVKKEQASIAAEQASLGATRVVYDEVNPVVETHVKEVIVGYDEDGNPIIEYEPLIEKLNAIKDSIRGSNSGLSVNEVHTQGVNQVLINELPADDKLQGKISTALSSAKSKISTVVETIINKNGGKDEYGEYKWFLNASYRIEVVAKSEFEAVHYNGINYGSDDDIPQRGVGPTISFIAVSGW